MKIGPILYAYSFNDLKWTTRIKDQNIQLLKETDTEIPDKEIHVSRVERDLGEENARTSFYRSHTVYVDDEKNDFCTWQARMSASLTLANVMEPVYEYYCPGPWDCGPDQLCGPDDCYWDLVGYEFKNYFEAFMYVDKEKGICSWGGYEADNRFFLKITGDYIQDGVSKSFFKTSAHKTSTLRHTMYEKIRDHSLGPFISVPQAMFHFEDLNNLNAPRKIEISYSN